MAHDAARLREAERVGVRTQDDDRAARWRATWRVERWHGDWTAEQLAAGRAGDPYEISEGEGNLIMCGGVGALWNRLVNTSPSVGAYDNAGARIGIGDSTAAEAATQVDLQAATNKVRAGMTPTYPQHTDGTGPTATTVTFQSSFDGSTANYDWREWGLFNAAGRMLNRRVFNQGTKASGSTWQFTVSLTLA